MTKTVAYIPVPETAASCVAWAPRLASIGADIEGSDAASVQHADALRAIVRSAMDD